MQRTLTSFDGTEVVTGEFLRPDRYRHLFDAFRGEAPAIPRGAGLSYCAASAAAGVRSISTLKFNRILAFDPETGLITVEPGIRLGDLYRFAAARGWTLPVMPGHPSISVGGCIGFNVHGKNQYKEGNFSSSVESLTVFHPDRGEMRCSRTRCPDLFHLTLGGFGLTGCVTEATLRLRPLAHRAMAVRRIAVPSLAEALPVMQAHAADDLLYSWHDFNLRDSRFGRGFVYAGRETDAAAGPQGRFRVLDGDAAGRRGVGRYGRVTTPLLLGAYARWSGLGADESVYPHAAASFPVNGREFYFRWFGRAGFREYQMLLPEAQWPKLVDLLPRVIAEHRAPITLASLKLFAGEARLLNFDGRGVCLGLNAPESPAARRLFAALDDLTLELGAIPNISKDSRLPAAVVARAYPGHGTFAAQLAALDVPRGRRRLDSQLRRRLEL